MSRVDQFAHQPISDTLIDELANLLYEAAMRSGTPRKEIRRIVGDFLNQQWQNTWHEIVRRVQQKATEPLTDRRGL